MGNTKQPTSKIVASKYWVMFTSLMLKFIDYKNHK